MAKDKKVAHYAISGDSLFGGSWACGTSGKGSVGYFEPEKVTCGACKRTNIFKQESG